MKIFPYKQIEAKEADEGAFKVKVRWLITKEMGAPNFAMRIFDVAPRGRSPLHSHPWEHEVYVLKGKGTVVGKNSEKKISPGDVVFVAPDELHQFKNAGKTTLQFICVVPIRNQ